MSAADDDSLFVYDEVAYPTPVLPAQTPSRMRSACIAFGYEPKACDTASMLEIGCGDGFNLIGCAAAEPAGRYVGFDLSTAAIGRGQEMLALSGLTNVDLHPGDITAYPKTGERFDYIVSHGVYGWVPEFVREALLDLVAARLAPGGVAMVSYDALPAAAPKVALNRFLRERTAHLVGPEAQLREAYRLVGILAAPQHAGSRLKPMLDLLTKELPHFEPAYFFHDFLAEHYAPASMQDFAAAAARRGLRAIGDAGMTDLFSGDLDDEARALIAAAGDDYAERAHLLDMLRGAMMFRRTFLVREDAPPPLSARGLKDLSYVFLGGSETGSDERGPYTKYTEGEETYLIVREPDERAIMAALDEAEPNELSFAELVARTGLSEDAVERFLARAVAVKLVVAQASPQPFVVVPGERPVAAPLIRTMMGVGNWAITLRHARLVTEPEPTRLFLTLCDGTRTRAELAAEMSARFDTDVTLALVEAAIADLGPRRVFSA
ncbi:MAG: methyltransferase domain-containing protein [Alphaproteobacteria bacterium]|nr:methyltransferase domain-containing protein [Alphaproteobacteria bacterium]